MGSAVSVKSKRDQYWPDQSSDNRTCNIRTVDKLDRSKTRVGCRGGGLKRIWKRHRYEGEQVDGEDGLDQDLLEGPATGPAILRKTFFPRLAVFAFPLPLARVWRLAPATEQIRISKRVSSKAAYQGQRPTDLSSSSFGRLGICPKPHKFLLG